MEFENSLIEHFSQVTDPRIDRTKKHNLIDIIIVTICAILSDCDSWIDIVDWAKENEEWLSDFLELPHGIPSHDTFGRVFAILNPVELEKAFFEWVSEVKKELPAREIINIDGKFIRGSKTGYNSRNALIMVSAWASRTGISLGQLGSRLKKDEGEKKVTEKLLDCIDIKGNIITLDAMGASPNIVNKIAEKNGDYVVALKENQSSISKLAKELLEKNVDRLHSVSTSENGHGRDEKRDYELLVLEEAETNGLNQGIDKNLRRFNNVIGIGKVISERTVNDLVSIESRYYLTSLWDIGEFAESVREHWAIENSLHWHMDVTFKEDYMRMRCGFAAENLSILRRLALNMLKQDKTENKSMRRKRKLCNYRKSFLLQIIFGFDREKKTN